MRRTARLTLEPLTAAHRDPLVALHADRAVMHWFAAPLDAAATDAFIAKAEAHWAEHGFGVFALTETASRSFVGLAGPLVASFPAHFTPCVELSWRLARTAWGRGYATEAARDAVRLAFEEAGIDQVVAFTVPANTRSRAVMERLAMRRGPADDFDHPNLAPGHRWRRHVLYRLAAADWRARLNG